MRISGGNGSRARGGRFVSSFNFSKVSRVPGATSSPPKPVAQTTTRPMQPTSRLWQPVSPNCPLPAVDVSSFLLQHHRRTWNWPPTKNSTLLSRIPRTFHGVSLSRSTHLEEADATTSVGLRRKSFHPLSWRTTSSLDASSKANRRAFLNGPFKQWGTLFITEARFFNLSRKSRPEVLPACYVAGGLVAERTSERPMMHRRIEHIEFTPQHIAGRRSCNRVGGTGRGVTAAGITTHRLDKIVLTNKICEFHVLVCFSFMCQPGAVWIGVARACDTTV